jgi:signal transduction histidine kinase
MAAAEPAQIKGQLVPTLCRGQAVLAAAAGLGVGPALARPQAEHGGGTLHLEPRGGGTRSRITLHPPPEGA